MNRPDVGAAAIAAARAKGCNCDPTVTLSDAAPGVVTAEVGHDHWCHLLAARSARSN